MIMMMMLICWSAGLLARLTWIGWGWVELKVKVKPNVT